MGSEKPVVRSTINFRRAVGIVVLLLGACLISGRAAAAPSDLCEGIVCDDHNSCTDDACNPDDGQCTYSNNANACSDGNACTTGLCGPATMGCSCAELSGPFVGLLALLGFITLGRLKKRTI